MSVIPVAGECRQFKYCSDDRVVRVDGVVSVDLDDGGPPVHVVVYRQAVAGGSDGWRWFAHPAGEFNRMYPETVT